MIYFFADDHFQKFCGRNIYKRLPDMLKKRIFFSENDPEYLESGIWEKDCELLILHVIGGTGGIPLPSDGAERAMLRYCISGRPMLLLHGSSAAFWHWDWWRKIAGLRWVRPEDPDHVPKSVHPHHPCRVEVAKVRHELARQLKPFDLPEDEIYIELEQTSPVAILMSTHIEEGIYPQCAECIGPAGAKIISFIPGHIPAAFEVPELTGNIATIIQYLLRRP